MCVVLPVTLQSRSCYLEMYKGKTPDKVNPAEGLLAK